VLVNSLMSSA